LKIFRAMAAFAIIHTPASAVIIWSGKRPDFRSACASSRRFCFCSRCHELSTLRVVGQFDQTGLEGINDFTNPDRALLSNVIVVAGVSPATSRGTQPTRLPPQSVGRGRHGCLYRKSPKAMRERIALRKHFPPQRAVRNLLATYPRYSLMGAYAESGAVWVSL
jgi:hypothetical protein